MIELWQVSIALLAVAFAAWFEVHSKYEQQVAKMEKARKEKAFHKMKEITEITDKEWSELDELFEASKEPTDLHESASNFFCYSGLIFLASILCRLGADLFFIQVLSPFESFLFLAGLIFFVGALINTRNLMKLLRTDVDPHISLSTMVIVAIIQSLNTYIIWQLIPAFLASTLIIYQEIFFVLLWLTFIGSGLFLFTADEDEKSNLAIVGMVLMFAPWVWMLIFIFGTLVSNYFLMMSYLL